MPARLMIQRPGEPTSPFEIHAQLTTGADRADGIRVPGLVDGGLLAWASPEGIVVEARAPGMVVSGQPLAAGKRRLLRRGDQAQAGDVALWPENLPASEGTRALAGAILAGAAAGSSPGPHLIVVEGPAAGDRFALGDGAVLGRGRGVQLRLADPHASRQHARFTIRSGRASLEDLGSKNGVAVNGRPARRSPIALRSGDALTLGESVLVYEDGCPSDPAAAPRSLAPAALSRAPPPPVQDRSATAAGLASGALIALAAVLVLAAIQQGG